VYRMPENEIRSRDDSSRVSARESAVSVKVLGGWGLRDGVWLGGVGWGGTGEEAWGLVRKRDAKETAAEDMLCRWL